MKTLSKCMIDDMVDEATQFDGVWCAYNDIHISNEILERALLDESFRRDTGRFLVFSTDYGNAVYDHFIKSDVAQSKWVTILANLCVVLDANYGKWMIKQIADNTGDQVYISGRSMRRMERWCRHRGCENSTKQMLAFMFNYVISVSEGYNA